MRINATGGDVLLRNRVLLRLAHLIVSVCESTFVSVFARPCLESPNKRTYVEVFAADGSEIGVSVLSVGLRLGGQDDVVNDGLFKKRRQVFAFLGVRGRSGT